MMLMSRTLPVKRHTADVPLLFHYYFKSSSNQWVLPIYLYFFQLEEFVLIRLFLVFQLIKRKQLFVIRIKIGLNFDSK